MNKFENFCDRNHEKREARKAKRKEKKEKFQQDHPILADAILKVEVGLGVLFVFSVPYLAGLSTKFEKVKTQAEIDGYNKAGNDFCNEFGREDRDFIDDDGKYHQDLHFGAYAVWPSAEAYLNAERDRLAYLQENDPE